MKQCNVYEQEAQLSQRNRATLRIFVYFTNSHSRSLKVIQNDTLEYGVVHISIPLKLCLYLVPFPRYSASNNGGTFKSGVWIVQGRRKWYYLKAWINFPIRIP